MKRIRRFFIQFLKGVRNLDPVVGYSTNSEVIYGRFDCVPDWLAEDEVQFWVWNAETKECESCFNIKKITEIELARYMGL